MLSKSYRMKKNSQFDYIFKNGKTIKNSKLLIFYSKCKSNNSKFGVVVSKKIGNSVTRNKVKRLIRENIRLMLPNINKNYNYIFVARSGIENLTFAEIGSIINKLLEKTELYV